jgi:CubicO group peptidase (beta-lactamase class C family)
VVAILQLWEQGRLGLDDRIGDYIDDWRGGKERCTLRHVLTHTGGFPNAGAKIFDADLP